MNRQIIRRLAGLLVIGLALSSGAAAAPKVGVLLKAKSEFWAAAEKGALAAGERLGAEVTVKAPLREADINVQVQFLNAFVAQGANAVVIAPASKDALAEPIAAALAKGVKVVVIDTMLASGQMPVFVGTDQREAGRAAGRFLADVVADGDEVSIFKHSQTSGATEQREIGAIEALRERHPNLVLHGNVYASGEPGVEAQRATLLVEQFPKARAILASGTPGTMAMLKVLQEKKLAGKVRFAGFGFNLNPTVAAAIEAGEMDAWIAQLPGEMGSQGVATALALIEGRDVPAVIRTEFIVITKANLADPKVQALLAP